MSGAHPEKKEGQISDSDIISALQTGEVTPQQVIAFLHDKGVSKDKIDHILQAGKAKGNQSAPASHTKPHEEHAHESKPASKPARSEKKHTLRLPTSKQVMIGAVGLLIIGAGIRFIPPAVTSVMNGNGPPIPGSIFPTPEPTPTVPGFFFSQPTAVPANVNGAGQVSPTAERPVPATEPQNNNDRTVQPWYNKKYFGLQCGFTGQRLNEAFERLKASGTSQTCGELTR